jgi:hypothetical protein
LTAIGPGGTSSSQVEVEVQALAPTVTLTANPAAIQDGGTATLSWTSSNAYSALLDNGIGVVELNGSMPISPVATTTYTISATSPGGSRTASATVTVFSGIRYYAYIPDYYEKKIRIIDTNTGAVCKTIEIAGASTNLQGVAAEASGVFAYVVDTGTTRIIKIDPLTMTNAGQLSLTANFQGKPKHIAISPNGCYLYATSSVPMWDPAAGKYVGNICAIKTSGSSMSAVRGVMTALPHQVSLEGLTVSPDSSRLFVADPDNNQILVLDAAKMQRYAADLVSMSDELITTIPIASPPLGVAFSPNGQLLYAFADSTLFEIDAQNMIVTRSVPVPYGSRFMQMHPDGSKIYVVTKDYLSMIETTGFTKSATVSITGLYYCTGLDVHPDGSRIFLVDKTSDKLITISTSTNQILFTTSVGTDPAAYGGFLGHLPLSISGNVTQDGSGLNGATVTLDGEGILRTKQTAVAGEFIFGLKPGDYQLTPTMSNLAFAPESTNLHVTESQTGLDFAVSGVVSPPTVTLSSSSPWVKPYESFTLAWDSTGADYVTLEVVTSENLPTSGVRTFSLQSTATIWAVAHNRGGTASASVKVFVSSSSPPTVGIVATPTSILQGGNSTLSWTSAYASTITIDSGIGTVSASGTKVVAPAVTTTYTITALHYNGYQVTAKATIEVIPIPPPTIIMVADPDMLVPGASSTLTWASTNATSVTIDNGIGDVGLNGNLIVNPTQDTTYTVVATGVAGMTMATVTVHLLETHLRSVWTGMKAAMQEGDITSLPVYFSEQTKDRYSYIFTAIADQLPLIATEMRDIELVYFEEFGAKFRIKRTEEIEGVAYDITYYIYFVQEEDCSWKILNY